MTKNAQRWVLAREILGDDTLSVIMPVYNLAAEIRQNLADTARLYEEHSIRAQLIPVDDGSSDGTREAIEEFVAESARDWRYVKITPVLLEKNGGKGCALKAGFGKAEGEYVMLLDGDLDIKPKQTPFFFEQMRDKKADIVIGSKRHRRSVVQYPWHRRLVSWVYFTLVRIFIGLPITDTQTGMKLFRRRILGDALERMLVKTYAFDLELLAIAHSRGARIAEAPVVIRFGNKFGALRPKTVNSMALDSLAVFYRLKILKYYEKAEPKKPLATPPFVSVVIACPGPSALLRECIAGLKNQTYANWEALILPDENFALEENDARIKIIPTGKVRPAEKRNEGIRLSRGDIVAFIDDDAYPDARWLEYAIGYFGAEDIGAVGGPGVTPPNDPFLAKIGGRIYSSLLVAGNYRYRYVAGGVRRDVDDYPSCNLFVRKSLLEKIGGYRIDFWPGEDTLLCKDIIDSGKRIVYDPWVIVNHHRRAIFAPHLRQLGRYAFHRGYFCKRFPSNSLHLAYFVPSLFTLYVALALGVMLPLWALSILPGIVFSIFVSPLLLYMVLAAASVFSPNPVAWLLGFAGVFATHATYGVRFLQGLAANKAPCEFIGKDKAK